MFSWVKIPIMGFGVFYRYINGYWISQSLNFEKQGFACVKTLFMLTQFAGSYLNFPVSCIRYVKFYY